MDIVIRTTSTGAHEVMTWKDSNGNFTFEHAKEIYNMRVEEVKD